MANDKREVAIFGAGIAGLTAAHELIERGFDVEVFEPEEPSLYDDVCAVGGMARTQWGRLSRPPKPLTAGAMPSTEPMLAAAERALEAHIVFDQDDSTLNATARQRLDAIAAVLIANPMIDNIEVRGFTHEPYAPMGPASRIDFHRASAVVDYLRNAGVTAATLTPVAAGLGRRDDWTLDAPARCYVDFHTIEDWVPGEHGFRFFPTFYRNVRDTLRRTPISVPGPPFTESARTMLDNLVATTSQGINLDQPTAAQILANPEEATRVHSYVMPRKLVMSPQALFDVLHDSLSASKFKATDIARLQVKMFKYLTSCAERREAELEQVSWWDFVGGDDYSPSFQTYLEQTPQALVAMTARECDARTYGNITVQITRDQFTDGRETDSTLNGPTSPAWLDHWRRHLESQGVVFRRGRLTGFDAPDAQTLTPLVDIYDAASGQWVPHALERDYYVMALSIEAAYELAQREQHVTGGDFDALRTMNLGAVGDAKPAGALQHLSGIQYYFRSEVKLLPGHTVYADSDWGLSSIFQTQFWMTKRGWWDGYRGLLTVGIGNWYKPSRRLGRCAWECTRDEIAAEVWAQILDTIPEAERAALAEPAFYHLDDNIEFGRVVGGRALPSGNKTRILINNVGTFRKRPGALGPPSAPGYALHGGRLVLAGTYMQTHFRLTTMEAANESGRHAANAILHRDAQTPNGFRGDRCTIANPEEHEFADLTYFIDLDRELFRQGLPHCTDILGLAELPSSWLGANPDLSLLGLLSRNG